VLQETVDTCVSNNFAEGMQLKPQMYCKKIHTILYILSVGTSSCTTLAVNIVCEQWEIEQVKSFRYLGAIVNTDNAMEEEIKERIVIENKVYFANKKMFQSRLISKRAKLKLYYLVIKPVVTYSCETWILKETIINKLLVFERKILRKIFSPNNENSIWHIKTNQELDEIIKRKNITSSEHKD
jgi:hypothetical protein